MPPTQIPNWGVLPQQSSSVMQSLPARSNRLCEGAMVGQAPVVLVLFV
ncbi:MAG: hypothetical protein AAF436_21295 [Myxococcota bacterium]